MLQQILQDMWVDPEILAELDETQKQTLFCKMREEQVRRWQVWDQKVSGKDEERPKVQKTSKKQVQFMQGEDGEPWVWVMGEHRDDKSIEAILAEEARERAVAQAREEAHQLRKSVEKELTQLIDYKPMNSLEQKFDLSPKSIESLEDNLDMYCSVEELRQRIDALEPEVDLSEKVALDLDKEDFCNDDIKLDINKNTLHFNFIEGKRDVLQELSVSRCGSGVSVRVAAWERRVAAARAHDLLRGFRQRRARALREPGEDAAVWRDQERKAKEAEATMRQIARAAREAHRRSADISNIAPIQEKSTSKPNLESITDWFRTNELPRGVGVDENNKPVEWFHGAISAACAERVVSRAGAGAFLVRVAARARLELTLRSAARTLHCAVRAGDTYALHDHPVEHASLADLISYHKRVPVTVDGVSQLLTSPCAPREPPLILAPLR